jgi:DNA-binding transcriptional LysR family regulator
MVDWENLRHFAALARGGSLSAAARLLDVEHATIARRVAALEAETGLRLVDRRGRRLSLTEQGLRIAAIAERMEGEALAVARAARGGVSELAGEVTISAPPTLAACVLAPRLVRLQARHPALRLRIIGETRRAALDRREADIAVRLSRPATGDLVGARLGDIAFRYYASPGYLAATPEAERVFIAYDADMDAAPQQQHLLSMAAGRPVAIRASTAEIQLAAARAGGGVVILPDYMAAGDPGLAEVEPAVIALTREIWLVVHADLQDAPAIRAVIDGLRGADGVRAGGS